MFSSSRNVMTRALWIAISCIPAIGYAGAEKDATKHLAKAAKSSVKTFKGVVKATTSGLYAGKIDVIDAEIDSGTVSLGDMVGLYTALNDYQLDVRDAYYAAYDQMNTGYQQGMAILNAASIVTADYPRSFFYGEAGPLDDFRFDLDKALASQYAKVRKRLEALSKRLAKKGIGLNVRLTAPVDARERSPSAFSEGGFSTAVPLTIDLAVAYSDLTVAGDGTVRVSGGALSASNLTVSRGTSSSFSNTFDILANSSDRWEHTYTTLTEGIFRLRVTPEFGGAFAHTAIGVR